MSNPDRSIDSRIINEARKMFLEKGFINSSLKGICKNANVTTGALYKRYSGKEELFYKIVSGTISDLNEIVKSKTPIDIKKVTNDDLIKAWDMDYEEMSWWFRYLFDRKDDIKLLLICSDGTKYRNFKNDWIEKMSESSYAFYIEAYSRNITKRVLSINDLKILQISFWTSIFEPIIMDYNIDELMEHNKNMCLLFSWDKIFNFKKGEKL